ncbi:MAG: hypothetical protein WD065_00265 [Planctomycetaceae bacterium]
MALVTCPECGKHKSDKAGTCPHCGFQSPVAELRVVFSYEPPAPKKDQSGCLGCLTLLAISGLIYWIGPCSKNLDEQPKPSPPPQIPIPQIQSGRIEPSKAEPAENHDENPSAPDAADFGPGLGKNASLQGRYAVWTDPDNPLPRKPYRIIVRIKVPSNETESYPIDDISGHVIVSDGHKVTIPPPGTGKFLKVQDRIVQFDVRVLGPDKLVRDRIVLRSALFNDEQTLEIVY